VFKNKQLVRKAVNKIAAAARQALQDLEDGRVQQEPAFTDRFIAYVQSQLHGRSLAGVCWSAVTLPDRGRNSAESQLGADLLSVVRFDLPGFSVTKGFLAQAKLVEPATSFSTAESQKLKEQCEKMLAVSPASFVFLYSLQSGVQVVPAIEVVGARDCNPHELTTRSIPQFFTEHFECFIGDRRFSAADGRQLEILREEYRARRVLALVARPGEGSR
jgi:hypothetical protein